MIHGVAFALALLCAAAMGLAIQRGATCTVAAVDEWVSARRVTRLLAILEASVWVSGGLLIARELGALFVLPNAHALTGWTLVGAVLLGLGALVNGACVFGAIARLGSGEWAYAATPLGFFVGCISVGAVFAPAPSAGVPEVSRLLHAPFWVAWLFAAYAVVRIAMALRSRVGATLRDTLIGRPWSPHAATIVIGVTFLAMLLLAGAWAYTDVLAELARGMANGVSARLWLALALLLGAMAGGWLSGRLRRVAAAPSALARTFAGGVLMGWGSLLIPGSNDGLILLGLPLLWPHAWVAFATMCIVIAVGLWTTQRFKAPRRPAASHSG